MEVGTLTPGTKIENEECVYCFNSVDDEEGINICLQCFTCCCCDHAREHFKERQHGCFLSRRRITTKSDADPNKLAIGVEGGFDDVKRTYEYEVRLFDENGYQVLPEEVIDTEEALDVIKKLKAAPSASEADQVTSWELNIVECPHVKELKQPEEKIPPRKCKCSDCELENNLWLCLTCGHIGCGRKNFDGSGGNNHAVDHYEKTHHPVVVKLGTISPDGRADLYCYQCDETVTDSHIAEHLAKFSIDVQSSVKTESTTTELNVAINKNWDFEAVTADGREYETMKGPFSVGLENLGNTCYMNSILQMLAIIKPFVDEYLNDDAAKARWTEPKRQFNRLFSAMADGKRKSVSPRLLRQVTLRDNPQFMTNQQQDAVEFFNYYSNYIKIHKPNTALNLSTFDAVQQIKCDGCGDASTTIPMKDLSVLVLVPPRCQIDDTEHVINIEDLLNTSFVQEIPERKCEKCQKSGATSRTLLKNFPNYLFVSVVQDAVSETGMLRKMNINVQFDPNNFDISSLRCKDVVETVDEQKVAELMNFGFTRAQCIRALENVSTVEQAVDWIIEHPMEQTPAIASVMEMGFTENEAREALEESEGNVALAIEWLFGPRQKRTRSSQRTDGNGVYELIGFVQHKGPSALCGHYVANIKRDGKWILYNDNKAAIYPDDTPPQFGKGYLYLFQRK